ncbi:hypothetical protein B0T18DRAFT_428596 [Schizothecium vesticola]|uniref:Uncharacterized protein n=1 Tax=Schizothecium vesticola TaxID=314040 RepID=A0AA40ETY8_9PEZI|nr:hypothetical protein B0T18DRAFT_428596 [Schizothecium vesticola]
MRLSQTVLTALVATSATALPVTEKQPTGEQQQQQVSPDHDGVQAQKFGKLDETAHKQPLGYNNDKVNTDKVNTDKKNTGSFSGLFTTNGQKESQGWAKIKSALSGGNGKQDDKLDSRRPNKGEFTDGNRQHGSNGVIQARHDPSEDVRLEKMGGGDRLSRANSGDMGFIGHEQYLDKTLNRPFRGEYIAPREIKKNGGNMLKDDMTMNMDTTMPNQEHEDWMRGGRSNSEWMRQGKESQLSKPRDQGMDTGMDKQFDSDRRQGQYMDELVKDQKESRTFSPMTQSWIVRFNNDATKDGKAPLVSSDEQIAGTIQMTYVDDRTPEQQHREVPNPHVKENRMLPNRVPHTYEPEMRRPWNQEDERLERQYNEYLNKGKPMTEQTFEYHDRQPNNGESKQFLNRQPTSETKENLDFQPTGEHGVNFSSQPTSGEVKEFLDLQSNNGETKEYRDRQPSNGETKEMLGSKPFGGETKQNFNDQSGRTQMELNQPSDGIHHTTDNGQKDSLYPEGEFQTAPYMSQKTTYRVVSPNNGNIQRRNRHTGTTQNSQVLPPSEDMSRDGSTRVLVNKALEKLTNREYTRPHTWLVTDPSIFGDDFLEPTDEKNMAKDDGKLVEPRELFKTFEHGRDESMHKDFKLICDAEGGFLCESTKDTVMPFETPEMMKTNQLKGSPKEGLADSQRQGYDQDKTFLSFTEHNPTKGTNNNNN